MTLYRYELFNTVTKLREDLQEITKVDAMTRNIALGESDSNSRWLPPTQYYDCGNSRRLVY